MVRIVPEHARTMLFDDMPAEAADKLATSLPAQPYAYFSTPVSWDPYQDPDFAGAVGYIMTGPGRIMPYELQKMYVATAGIAETEVLEGSSHSPHMERPADLSERVLAMVVRIQGGAA